MTPYPHLLWPWTPRVIFPLSSSILKSCQCCINKSFFYLFLSNHLPSHPQFTHHFLTRAFHSHLLQCASKIRSPKASPIKCYMPDTKQGLFLGLPIFSHETFLQDSAQIGTPLGSCLQSSPGRVYGSVHSVSCLSAPAWTCDFLGLCSVFPTLSLILSASRGNLMCDITVFPVSNRPLPSYFNATVPCFLSATLSHSSRNPQSWVDLLEYIFVGGEKKQRKRNEEKKGRKAVSVEMSAIESVVTMEMVLNGYRACTEWSTPLSQGNWCWECWCPGGHCSELNWWWRRIFIKAS